MAKKTQKEESFIERLERLLKDKNLQKKDLANAVGISQTGISTWRVSGTLPRADMAIRIARYLNVSVEYLILGELKNLDKEKNSLEYKISKLSSKNKKIIEAVYTAILDL